MESSRHGRAVKPRREAREVIALLEFTVQRLRVGRAKGKLAHLEVPLRTWLATLTLVLSGCGGDTPIDPAEYDASVDAAPDGNVGKDASADAPGSGPDVAPDVTGVEPTPDAQLPDAPPDAPPPDGTPDVALPDLGPDLGIPDTGPDLGVADATPDAAVSPDMGADGPAAPCVQVPGTPPLGLLVVETGFSRPSDIQAPPDDPRLFVTEQDGLIWIIDGGVRLGAPFLDLTLTVNAGGNEQGLLGLAFHPGYAANGRFFVYYTDASDDIQISEFGVSADPNVALTTETPVLNIPHQEATNHNGGQIAFHPADGLLYIAVGDGGNSCDSPTDDAQSTTSLRGKLLRIDVDMTAPYEVPVGNPFANEIWAYGLRNPWRFSFDRMTSDIYIGDVGQNAWEEIDVQPATSMGGENYGWNDWEADVCQDGSMGTSCTSAAGCATAGFEFPTHSYPHAPSLNCFGVGGSVTGGYVYRGCEMPGYHGTYFYADYCLGTVHSFVYSGGMATNLLDWPTLDATISTFGQDHLGELYVADPGSGDLYRIAPQ